MPIDIAINEDLQTTWNGVGDLTKVYGEDQIEQAVAISIIERAGLSIPTLTDTAIEQKRGAIEQAVAQNQHTESDYTVVVADIDYDNGVVTYAVETDRIELFLDIES